MKLTRYSIEVNGIEFNLQFKDSLILVDGKSGLGKTMLFKQVKNDALVNNKGIICLDYGDLQSNNVANIIGNVSDKTIFIDNAEVVLDDKQRLFISFDTHNQYIVFTHSSRGFKPRKYSFATLCIKDNLGFLQYDLE